VLAHETRATGETISHAGVLLVKWHAILFTVIIVRSPSSSSAN